MGKVFADAERVRIREAVKEDLPELVKIYSSPAVLKFNCIQPADEELALRNLERGYYRYSIELKESGRIIGTIGLVDDDLRYNAGSMCLSYDLDPDFVGRGYMSEALRAFLPYCFGELGLDLITARVFADNEKSLAVMRRLGFLQEGRLRRAVMGYDGKIHDDCLFSIVKSEL